MTDLISESQSYQSDVTAMQTAKTMFSATLEVLK
jgi:flagellar basal-body rod protein FlgC